MTSETEAAELASQLTKPSEAQPPTSPAAVDQAVSEPAIPPLASEPAPEQPASEQPAPEVRPSERLQLGTQRADDSVEPAKANPVSPIVPSPNVAAPKEAEPAKSNYPPPNIRDQLSPELEAELEAALGGESLDTIIDSSATPEATGDQLAPDTKITGTVAKIHREDIFLELGGRSQGLLPLKQFEKTTPPEIGTQIEVVVARYNAAQGLYEVSLPTAAVSVGNWDDVEVGQIVNVAITGSNKGGLECQLSGIRGFIPMGQISIYRIENAEEFVGQNLGCVITEANRSKRNLVLSHRALMERERKEQKEKLLAELAPGQIREGVVRSLQDFGAFVDLGGVDGLLHVSQISWDRIDHPRDVLKEGQTIKVRVEKVNQENGRISLVYRDLAANPWEDAPSKYPVGATISGTVTKLMQFGAFVKLEPGVEGLIHISEMGHGRVNRAGDVVSEGQKVDIKILSVDVEAQRIGLSLKALMAAPERPATDQKRADTSAEDEAARRRRKKSNAHLKGGIGGPSGGEQFGLKW